MNRIDRLTAIIIFLQDRHRVTVEELSIKYGVNPRTVYSDLAVLPSGDTGWNDNSRVGLLSYQLKTRGFPRRTEKYGLMQKRSNTELSKSYLSALDKIRAVLSPHEKEYYDTLDRHIKAFHYNDEYKNFLMNKSSVSSKCHFQSGDLV